MCRIFLHAKGARENPATPRRWKQRQNTSNGVIKIKDTASASKNTHDLVQQLKSSRKPHRLRKNENLEKLLRANVFDFPCSSSREFTLNTSARARARKMNRTNELSTANPSKGYTLHGRPRAKRRTTPKSGLRQCSLRCRCTPVISRRTQPERSRKPTRRRPLRGRC